MNCTSTACETAANAETGLLARSALAIGGGYIFASGAVAMFAILLVCFGIPRPQVAETATLCGIPTYLVAALWVFGECHMGKVGIVLVGLGLGLRIVAGLLGYVI